MWQGCALFESMTRMLSLLCGDLIVEHIRLVGIWKFLAISPKRRTSVLTDLSTTLWTRLGEPFRLLSLIESCVG